MGLAWPKGDHLTDRKPHPRPGLIRPCEEQIAQILDSFENPAVGTASNPLRCEETPTLLTRPAETIARAFSCQ
jgi:hypothetical protein